MILCNAQANVPDSIKGYPTVKELCETGIIAHSVSNLNSSRNSSSYVVGRSTWDESLLSTLTCKVQFTTNSLLSGKEFALACGHSHSPYCNKSDQDTESALIGWCYDTQKVL